IRDFHVTGVQTCALPILVPVFWLDTMSISKAVYGADVAHSHLALSARLGRDVKKNSDALKDAKGKYLRDMSPELIEFLKRYNARSEERRVGKAGNRRG